MAVNHQNLSKKSLQTSLFTGTQYLTEYFLLIHKITVRSMLFGTHHLISCFGHV